MKYKLIKTYPGSPKLNTICKYEGNAWSDSNEFTSPIISPENYPEFWQPVVEKDYEILSLVHKEQNRILLAKDANIDIFLECKLDYNYWSTHSIKRLSDSEIFTIGDIIDTRVDNKYKQEILEINLGINDLLLKDKLIFKTKSGYVVSHIAVKVKMPLFTTEDGVDIYENIIYYGMNKGDLIIMKLNSKDIILNTNRCVTFSTKEKAEEYILMNKPCLSLQEISTLKNGKSNGRISPLYLQKLKELVKQKINK